MRSRSIRLERRSERISLLAALLAGSRDLALFLLFRSACLTVTYRTYTMHACPGQSLRRTLVGGGPSFSIAPSTHKLADADRARKSGAWLSGGSGAHGARASSVDSSSEFHPESVPSRPAAVVCLACPSSLSSVARSPSRKPRPILVRGGPRSTSTSASLDARCSICAPRIAPITSAVCALRAFVAASGRPTGGALLSARPAMPADA